MVVIMVVGLSCGRRSYTYNSSTSSAREFWLLSLRVVSRVGLVFVFVACLAIVQVLCGLTHHVLELHRLGEIRVPQQVFLSVWFTTLYFLVMSCISTLSSYELVLEFFLCVGVSHREAVILCGTSCALVVFLAWNFALFSSSSSRYLAVVWIL